MMEDFFTKRSYSFQDINYLIDDKVEESISLEFKSAGSLDRTDSKKNEIGKDVSALANSAGGLLIYGLHEIDHRASEISPIDGSIFTKEWLEHVISERVRPKIENLKIFPIRINDEISKSIYIVQIPASATVHMNNKKYYKRYNFENTAMEEYEVRNLYLRSTATSLQLCEMETAIAVKQRSAGKIEKVSLSLRFHVKNTGTTIELHHKTILDIPKQIIAKTGHELFREFRIGTDKTHDKYAFPNLAPLFPEEKDLIFSFKIDLGRNDKKLLDSTIKMKLYYTGGSSIKERDLREIWKQINWES